MRLPMRLLSSLRHSVLTTHGLGPGWRWITVLAVFSLMVVCAVWITFPEWLVGGESGSETIRNLVLAIVALIALPVAIWRSVVAERQANAAQRQSVTARRGLWNERYQKGAEMLGSSVLSVRLGGIYALERLARNHSRGYHIQIMQLFSAFVRNPTKDEFAGAENPQGRDGRQERREDVQAILEFLGKRSSKRRQIERKGSYSIDLRYAEMPAIRIIDADLSDMLLSNCNLSNSFLRNVNVSGADLSETDLSGATLWGANLSGARLVSANLSRSRLDYANFSEHTVLENANLSGANLEGVCLSDANLSGADLSRSELLNANLSGANLDSADLSEAKLIDSNLANTNLVCAKLIGANMARCNLSDARLDDAELSGAILTDANLARVGGLTQVQLDRATGDAEPHRYPKLEGAVDEETGEFLVWNGRTAL